MPQLYIRSLQQHSRDRNVFNAKVVCYKLFEIDTKVIWELGFHKASLGEWASERASAFLDIRPFEKSNSIRRALLKHYWWEKQDSWVPRAICLHRAPEKLALCESTHRVSLDWAHQVSNIINLIGEHNTITTFTVNREEGHRQIIPISQLV